MKIAINNLGVAVEVLDTVTVKTVNGVHYLLTPAEVTEQDARAAAHVALQPTRDRDVIYAKRVAGYGTIGSQLDLIYHSGLPAWQTHIAAIKAANPLV